MSEDLEGKHGVQSMEVGLSLLKAMVGGRRSMMLKEIATAAGMPPSKAHRYLVSLIRAGLVEQEAYSSRYSLGPFALNLGLVALDRLDRIRLGLTAVANLRDTINETTALAVWSDTGPVIVRWERPRRPITVNVVTGTTLGMLSTTAGRVFAAWLPEERTASLIAGEIEAGQAPASIRTLEDARELLARIRQRGVAVISGDYIVHGIEALAAPVFNFQNEITLALVVVGVQGSIDLGDDSQVIRELKNAAHALSERLGSTQVIASA